MLFLISVFPPVCEYVLLFSKIKAFLKKEWWNDTSVIAQFDVTQNIFINKLKIKTKRGMLREMAWSE